MESVPVIQWWTAEHILSTHQVERLGNRIEVTGGAAPGQGPGLEGPQAPCTGFSAALRRACPHVWGAPRHDLLPGLLAAFPLTFRLYVGTHHSGCSRSSVIHIKAFVERLLHAHYWKNHRNEDLITP